MEIISNLSQDVPSIKCVFLFQSLMKRLSIPFYISSSEFPVTNQGRPDLSGLVCDLHPFHAPLLDDVVRVANNDTRNGSTFLGLYLLASLFLWLLTWYLVWRILRKGLISQDKRAAKRGISYLWLMLSLFCLAAYSLDYGCKQEPRIFMLAVIITEISAYFFFL